VTTRKEPTVKHTTYVQPNTWATAFIPNCSCGWTGTQAVVWDASEAAQARAVERAMQRTSAHLDEVGQ
jgi:hypothetical protein